MVQPHEDASPEALAQFTQSIYLIKHDSANNCSSFYRLHWQPPVNGKIPLVCTWGQLGAAGHVRITSYDDKADAYPTIVAILQQCLHEGYQVMEWH